MAILGCSFQDLFLIYEEERMGLIVKERTTKYILRALVHTSKYLSEERDLMRLVLPSSIQTQVATGFSGHTD